MRLGARSAYALATTAKPLQNIILSVVDKYDLVVIEGYVSRMEQDLRDNSYPNNKENRIPSLSCKIIPSPHYHKSYTDALMTEIAREAKRQQVKICMKDFNGIVTIELDDDSWRLDTTDEIPD